MFKFFKIVRHSIRWMWWVLPVSIVVGTMVALFLWLLEMATQVRQVHIWLIGFLPLAGVCIYWLYGSFGKDAEKGNDLIIDTIHEPKGRVPLRMAPLVLTTTVITHLFGGSAGREGTAVQMGGSIADHFAKKYNLEPEDRRMLLMTGIAAGFGAVFGTPLTGAIFALEVLAIGRIRYDALMPCLIAGIVADRTCNLFPIHHVHYSIKPFVSNVEDHMFQDLILLLKVLFAGVCFGLISSFFATCTHFVKSKSQDLFDRKWLIPVVGGILVLGISLLLGTTDYLGLGVYSPNADDITIVSAFSAGGADPFSWFWKLLLTAITLGMGFKGGEVTPLFFMGATLGNTLAVILGAPIDLFAGLGFIAVFAGATNTPLACTLMGIELFGAESAIYYGVACCTAYYFSGHSGIYSSQRVAVSKIRAAKS